MWLAALVVVPTVVATANAARPRGGHPSTAASGVAATARPSRANSASRPPSASRATDPSPSAIPTTPPAGWSLAFADNFTGDSLSARWFTYDGQPAGDPGGYFSSSHVHVGDGVLRLKGYRDRSFGGRWVTAGVQVVRSLRQTYGQYLVRFRVQNGQGIAYALVLWPASNRWPPEVDFAEDSGAAPRRSTLATIHYADAAGTHRMIHRSTAVDLTRWHTLGVKWTPGHITLTLDGTAWATVASSTVPTVPMDLAMQTQAWDCGHRWDQCPDSTTPPEVDMTVDWVVAYRRA
jgi:hypothetical protein